MTSLTLLVVASWLFALYRRNPLLAVAFGGMTPSGAFVVIGGIALPTVYASVLFALVAYLLLRVAPSRSTGSRGITWLWVFALWVVIVTVTAPFLFAGTTVLALGGARRTLDPETFLTSSNIAQLLYLVLGVAAAAMAAARPQNAMWCIFLALAGASLLSLWRYAGLNLGLPFPFDLFDNSPAFRYIDGAPGGVVRFRGILSEPAALAASSLACVAMGAALLRRSQGLRRVLVLVSTGAAVFNVTQSTSSTAVLVAVVLVMAAVVVSAGGLVLRGRRWSSAASIAAVVLVVLAAWVLPIAGAYVQTVIDAKVGTSSYDERSGTDLYSYGLVLQTLGWGVGVGSNRPSSFLAALLAGTGVVGAVLFFGIVLQYSFRASRVGAIRPVLWCLFAILLAKLVASPDLSDTSGTMWLAIGALIGSARALPLPVRSARQPRHRTAEPLT